MQCKGLKCFQIAREHAAYSKTATPPQRILCTWNNYIVKWCSHNRLSVTYPIIHFPKQWNVLLFCPTIWAMSRSWSKFEVYTSIGRKIFQHLLCDTSNFEQAIDRSGNQKNRTKHSTKPSKYIIHFRQTLWDTLCYLWIIGKIEKQSERVRSEYAEMEVESANSRSVLERIEPCKCAWSW